MMYEYALCIGICTIIWALNGKLIIQAVKEDVTSEIYMHTGLGIFFSLLTIEWTLAADLSGLGMQLDISWLKVIGFIPYIPSAYRVVASMRALKRYGTPETGIETTTFVDAGIFKIIRQPMTLGMAIWSVALIQVFQSALSVILGVVSLFCFYMSARTESEYDILKYGDDYREYMRRVPMWNIARGMRKERGCDIG